MIPLALAHDYHTKLISTALKTWSLPSKDTLYKRRNESGYNQFTDHKSKEHEKMRQYKHLLDMLTHTTTRSVGLGGFLFEAIVNLAIM